VTNLKLQTYRVFTPQAIGRFSAPIDNNQYLCLEMFLIGDALAVRQNGSYETENKLSYYLLIC